MVLRRSHVDRVVVLEVWGLRVIRTVIDPRVCRRVVRQLDIMDAARLHNRNARD